MMRVGYIAHQLGAPTVAEMEANRKNAELWLAWIAYHFDVAPVASWISLSRQWPESEKLRKRGLEIDCVLIRRCDEIWLVGGRISDGMRIEMDAARDAGVVVIDLTALGHSPPSDLMIDAVRYIVEQARAA
ncbi:MAG TPA: DUF4406 domain-containing protein [Steroidobacteraceae bacterium]